MSSTRQLAEIEYPESDGQPMGETDVHIEWIIRLRDILRLRYRDQRVYVGSDMLVYYQEGEPSRYVVPDNFVVLDCQPGRRRTFKIWEEQRTPDVVFEITSLSSKLEDRVHKPKIYARMGVHEYFVFDPTGDYLVPPLRGWRRRGDEFVHISAGADGELASESLDLLLSLDRENLVLRDRSCGTVLLTGEETQAAAAAAIREETLHVKEEARRSKEEALRSKEEARRSKEEARRSKEETRRAQEEALRIKEEARQELVARLKAEAEAETLREKLRRLQHPSADE